MIVQICYHWQIKVNFPSFEGLKNDQANEDKDIHLETVGAMRIKLAIATSHGPTIVKAVIEVQFPAVIFLA